MLREVIHVQRPWRLSEKWWLYSTSSPYYKEGGRIRRKCKQDATLCSVLREAVLNDSPIRAKHHTARYSTAQRKLRVSYKVFFCAWSSKLYHLAPSVHYNDAGNWKTTPRPLDIIHERKLLWDERCGWVHSNSSRPRDWEKKRTLKVIGWIVGIIQNEKALDKCFLSTRAVQITAWTCCIIRQWQQRQQNTTPPNHRREWWRMFGNWQMYSVNTETHSWHLKARTRFITFSQRNLWLKKV